MFRFHKMSFIHKDAAIDGMKFAKFKASNPLPVLKFQFHFEFQKVTSLRQIISTSTHSYFWGAMNFCSFRTLCICNII